MTLRKLRSILTFLFRERVGFHRPSPVTPGDHQQRAEFLARDAQLRRAIGVIDATRELWSMDEQIQQQSKGRS